MTYELYLTDKCTRHCSLCYIKNTSYVESLDNLKAFCDEVNADTSEKTIVLFGGEPLLNVDGLQYVLSTIHNAKFVLVTNADLLNVVKVDLSNVYVQISAYDIFSNVQKYVQLAKTIKAKDIVFSFTFDQSTISRFSEFIFICEENNLNYRFAFSHTELSWNSIDIDELYTTIKSCYLLVLNQPTDKWQKCLYGPLKRIVQSMLDHSTKSLNCISDDKRTFYKGKFLNIPCIQSTYQDFGYVAEPIYCTTCKYRLACMKSCRAEWKNHIVPPRLCKIEQARIDAYLEIISKNIHRECLQQIIKSQTV